MIMDKLDISKNTIWKTVIKYMIKRKICWCCVVHALTAEQEKDQAAACQDLIEMVDSDPDFFKKNHIW
jgi:hypothetical protein